MFPQVSLEDKKDPLSVSQTTHLTSEIEELKKQLIIKESSLAEEKKKSEEEMKRLRAEQAEAKRVADLKHALELAQVKYDSANNEFKALTDELNQAKTEQQRLAGEIEKLKKEEKKETDAKIKLDFDYDQVRGELLDPSLSGVHGFKEIRKPDSNEFSSFREVKNHYDDAVARENLAQQNMSNQNYTPPWKYIAAGALFMLGIAACATVFGLGLGVAMIATGCAIGGTVSTVSAIYAGVSSKRDKEVAKELRATYDKRKEYTEAVKKAKNDFRSQKLKPLEERIQSNEQTISAITSQIAINNGLKTAVEKRIRSIEDKIKAVLVKRESAKTELSLIKKQMGIEKDSKPDTGSGLNLNTPMTVGSSIFQPASPTTPASPSSSSPTVTKK